MLNTKRIAQNTIMLYVRMAITMFIGLFSVRILLNTLGDIDYGIYNVVSGVVAMMAFVNNALASTTQRFISYEMGCGSERNLQIVFSTSLAIYVYFCIVVLILGETIGLWFLNNKLNIPVERMHAAHWAYQLSLLSFVFSVLSAPYNAVIISYEKMNVYAYISILDAIIKIGLISMLVFVSGDKLIIYAIMMTLVVVVEFCFYIIYCRVKFKEYQFSVRIDKNVFSRIAGFAGWNIFGTLSNVFSGQGLNILLNTFFGVIVNTARGIAYQLDSAINTLVQNFFTAVRPQITKLIAEGETHSVNYLLYFSTKIGFFLITSVGIFVIYEMPSILTVWLGEATSLIVDYSRLVLISFFFGILVTPLSFVISGTGNVRMFNISNGILTMLNLPISYILLSIYPNKLLPFYVLIILNFIRWINAIYQTMKLFDISVYTYIRIVVKLFVCSAIVILIGYIPHSFIDNYWLRFAMTLVVVLLTYSIVFWYMMLDVSEKNSIYSYIRSILNRK